MDGVQGEERCEPMIGAHQQSYRCSDRLLRLVGKSVVVAALMAVPLRAVSHSADNSDQTIAVHTPVDVNDLRKLEGVAQEAVAKVLPAVVAIGFQYGDDSGSLPDEGRRFASGVLIREDGLIVSQYHVSHTGPYDDATGLRVYGKPGDTVDVVLSDGRRMKAQLLGGERLADISLLRLLEPGSYPFANFSSSESTSLGEWVIKLGHPAGYQPARGAVSRLGRVLYVNPVNIVADCMTAGGDSGGPLINLRGEIVGIIQDSYVPQDIREMTGNRCFPMSYMTAKKIQEKMGSMLAGVVPHETTFADHEERKRQYSEILASLSPDEASRGAKIMTTWQPVATQTRNSLVEVLDGDKLRAAYGTVIGQDGWIVTKASAISEYPFCRLPNGDVVATRIVGADTSLDLALLKANADDLDPVQWDIHATYERNIFVMATRIDAHPLTVGVVSAPLHKTPVVSPAEKSSPARFPRVFEHDMPLQPNQHGGPVINLAGEAIGITIADAGLHGCLSIPALDIILSIKRMKKNVE